MKFLYSLLIIGFLGLNSNSTVAQTMSLSDLEWIVGTWAQQIGGNQDEIIETWKKVSDTELYGENITKDPQGNVKLVEKMRLVDEGGVLYFVADHPANPAPVKFRIERINNQSFVSRNNQNDFPKIIIYTRVEDEMYADLSGGGRQMRITFKRIEFIIGD